MHILLVVQKDGLVEKRQDELRNVVIRETKRCESTIRVESGEVAGNDVYHVQIGSESNHLERKRLISMLRQCGLEE